MLVVGISSLDGISQQHNEPCVGHDSSHSARGMGMKQVSRTGLAGEDAARLVYLAALDRSEKREVGSVPGHAAVESIEEP